MILLNYIVQVLTLAQPTASSQGAIRFESFDRDRVSRILVHVDDARVRILGLVQNLTKEALGGTGVAPGGEQEVNRLAFLV